ncbi:MAG: carboxylating nicotinate-nucleotide diphosphorylase [Methanolinea sp.]|nr:carboxylating nicotinate-nucleotide diphosphorylase [Methanolinea sp.]
MIPLDVLLSFVKEDAPFGDVTSDAVLDGGMCRAVIVAGQDGVAAGLEEASRLFSAYGVEVFREREDGSAIPRGSILLSLAGPDRSILLVERTALNIIGRMSGIATRTRELQDLLDQIRPGCRIAATRKTAPGLRLLDKKAVMLGRGEPHRSSLSDGFLIKDNHLVLVPIEVAVRRAKALTRYKPVEVEAGSPEEAEMAARAGADILLLDNMDPGTVNTILQNLKREGLLGNLVIEVSGGIHDEDIREFALPGVDIISLGSLTHSVRNFDVSLDVLPPDKTR